MTNKKGQAGLGLFLTVIAMLFVIGILVMAFVLASAQIQDQDIAYDRTSAATVLNEVHVMNGTLGYFDLTYSTLNGVRCTVSAISNGSIPIGSGNYSVSNCRISNLTSTYNTDPWTTNYTYTYLVPNQVGEVINDSTVAIAGATDWFAIFITVAAVVVLILLIVLIVISLRGAGMMGQGGA